MKHIDIHNDPAEKKTNTSIGKSIVRAGKKREVASKMKRESSYGLPHGEKETPQLRKRFKNYYAHLKKTGGLGYLDKQKGGHILKQNNFYEFNKEKYD